MSTDEQKKMCEAIYETVDAGLITIRDLGKAFGRIAQLTATTNEEVSAWKKRIKQIE